jgi:ABC-type nickel/cobalt efflux system permease component RcnA
LAVAASLAVAATAWAHPLGNFTINHFSEVTLAGNVVRVAAVYDLAEIPTFQETQLQADDPTQSSRLVDNLAGGLRLTLDGRRVPLRLIAHRTRLLPGQAGLSTMRIELALESPRISTERHSGAFLDATYAGHLGWREIVVVADGGARISSSTVPEKSLSARLTNYPSDRLASPLAISEARFDYLAGAASSSGGGLVDGAASGFRTIQDRFSSLVSAGNLTPLAIALSLLTAVVLGALHALEPGHGKAIMAGYLVGTRGRSRDAAVLGLTITATHTAGVFALGVVTLTAAGFITPERLYPILNAISGLLVLGIGAALLLRTLRGAIHPHQARHDHDHGGHSHHHPHDGAAHSRDRRPHAHDLAPDSQDAAAHSHDSAPHSHDPAPHSHDPAPHGRFGRLGIIGVGISGGLIPCPSALVVLLAAVSLHRVLLGLALIVAFSAGLAAVLTGVGMVLAGGRGLISRLGHTPGWRRAGRPLAGFVPAASALVVSAVGVGLTAQAFQTLR